VIPDPRQHSAEEILRDGGSILIRAIRPDDRERLVEHFHRLSARSVYFRFFNAKRRLTDDELDRFTRLDFVQQAALVATLRERRDERIIGVGRYAMLPGDTHAAEVAFAVADEHQGRGIGTLLLEHLVRLARANGVTEFQADVLGENNRRKFLTPVGIPLVCFVVTMVDNFQTMILKVWLISACSPTSTTSPPLLLPQGHLCSIPIQMRIPSC